jgi:DNA-binding transcriptional regulator GbsR (MarR family)
MNNVRASDPISSVIAGERAVLFAGNHYGRILEALGDEKSLTAGEMAQATGMSVEQVCRRLPELQARGQVQVVQFEGEDLLRNGYRVWEAT